MVLTDVFSVGYFQSILGFWHYHPSPIDALQLSAENDEKRTKASSILQSFLGEDMLPHHTQLNRPFGLIFATGWSLTERT